MCIRDSHTVSMAFVRSAVRALTPAQRESALAQAGIAVGLLELPAARVPAAAFAALWMAVARALDDEFFGLDARRMKVGSFALLCRAAAAPSTLQRALELTLRGFGLFLDDVSASLVVCGREARIELINRIRAVGDEADARRFADETLLVMIHGMLCWLAGRRVRLTRLEWAHAETAHADEYRRMFCDAIRFDAARTAIAFDARVLQARVVVGAGSLRAFLRDAPQSVFLKQVASAGWSERVRRELRRALGDGSEGPTLDALAQGFGLSPATLRRRLDAEGNGWQQLKDGLRRELAIDRLADPGLSIQQVAECLGFNDASSFHRAFRKWTGAAPGAYRSQAVARARSVR